jgi:hypothetical protein
LPAECERVGEGAAQAGHVFLLLSG